MVKRLWALLLALTLTASMLSVMATDYPGDEIPAAAAVDVDYDQIEELPASATVGDALPARSAILIDQGSGQVLFEKNADEQLHPASITKVMTLLLAMEALESGRISMDDDIVTSEHANSMGGSQIWLKVGETMSMDDILKAVAISSANDASVALGEHIAGTEDAFVDMMNKRAQELGMMNTHFVNSSGLDAEGHLTTARDISIMSRELMKHPRIMEYSTIWMDSLRGGETQLVNTNKLVRFYEGATGLKTGTTSQAGSCLSATATRNGTSLVAVVMGCDTSQDRFASATGLLDYGFANYTAVTAPPVDPQLTPVKVVRGVEDWVRPTYTAPPSFVVAKDAADKITQKVSLVDDVHAPVEKGQVLGKVVVYVNDEAVTEYSLVAEKDIPKMDFPSAFSMLTQSMLTMNYVRPLTPPGREKKNGETGDRSSAEEGDEDFVETPDEVSWPETPTTRFEEDETEETMWPETPTTRFEEDEEAAAVMWPETPTTRFEEDEAEDARTEDEEYETDEVDAEEEYEADEVDVEEEYEADEVDVDNG